MTQNYFAVELSTSVDLGIPLADLVCVTQFEPKDICLVPGVATFWHGVVNFKGSLLWVLDSDRAFDLAAVEELEDRLSAVVIACQSSNTQRQIAMVVRQLKGILTVEPEQLEPLPDSVSALFKNSCTSAIREENKSLYLLNSQVFLQQLPQHSILSA